MIFGRKDRRTDESDGVADAVDGEGREGAFEREEAVADATDASAPADVDPRADGPFDVTEVDLDADDVERVAFGPLIITPFEGLGLQLHGDQESGTVRSVLATLGESGLELALFAAPRSDGLAGEIREETIDEATQGGGHAALADGPFGPEVRRVLPIEGPEGEQLFHVSRIWLVEGPRWLLRGTLMGRAGMVEGEAEPADVFVEFFRNIVVARDDRPRVPGELIPLALPSGAQG